MSAVKTLDLRGLSDDSAHKFALVDATLALEGAVLGLLLWDPSLAADCPLTPDDFLGADVGSNFHGRVYAALVDDAREGRETGLHIIQARFAEDQAASVGDAGYLHNLWDQAGPVSGLHGLVTQVASAAAQRRLARAVARPGLTASELQAIVQSEGRRLEVLDARTKPLRATPYPWTDAASIPRREWLYDRHLIRRFVSTTVAPGGVGKSSLTLVEALAMVTGRPLLDARPTEPLRVWLINLEDPIEETQRRVAAACLHYGLSREELGDRLYIASGRETPIVIARAIRGGVEVCTPRVRELEREITDRQIDVVMIDPFVDCHEVGENDNGAINVVVKQWAGIADRCACAVELIHHVRKPSGDRGEITTDDARGAGALIGGVRSARVINVMNKEEATEFGISERRSYFRVDNGKANLAPPSSQAKWRRLASVDLENGPSGFSDFVGVVTSWQPPSAFADVTPQHTRAVQEAVQQGRYRDSEQANAWVGRLVAATLGWDADDKQDRAKIKQLLKAWKANKVLAVEMLMDEVKRELKPFVVVGDWVDL